MANMPIVVTEAQFEQHFRPHLSRAKRGYACKIALYKVFTYIVNKLRTGCQWEFVPIDTTADGLPEGSSQAPSYPFRQWSQDGSLQRRFDASSMTIQGELHVSEINVAGSHSVAKTGAKPSPITVASKRSPALSYQDQLQTAR